jgi:hypothetical protein
MYGISLVVYRLAPTRCIITRLSEASPTPEMMVVGVCASPVENAVFQQQRVGVPGMSKPPEFHDSGIYGSAVCHSRGALYGR